MNENKNMQQQTLEEMLNQLREKVSKREINVQDVSLLRSIHRELDEKWREFETLLLAIKSAHTLDKEKTKIVSEVDSILSEHKPEKVSELMEKLRKAGYSITNTIVEKSNIEPDKVGLAKILYRVAEQTRMRNRSQVFYLLVRTLIAEGVSIPKELAEAFKPIYNDEEFASMIYAFITGVQQRVKYHGSDESNQNQTEEKSQNQ